MTELFACIGLFLGLCGHVHTARFDTEAQCLSALQEIKSRVGDGYAYCRPLQKKETP